MSGPITVGNNWLNATEIQRETYASQYYNTILAGVQWASNNITWSASSFSAQDIQELTYFLNYLSSIVNVHFTYTSSTSSNITLGYQNLPPGAGGVTSWSSMGGYLNHASIGISTSYTGTISTPGSNGYSTLIHEFGHALGFKHPGNYNVGGGGTPPPYLPTTLDTAAATVMSYDDFALGGPSRSYFEQSYMPIDIQGLLHLYGAVQGIPLTGFTFQFSQTAAFSYSIQNATVNMYAPFYLYDANHAVTLDFSQLNNVSEHLTVDLRDYGILYAPTSGLAYEQYNYSTAIWSSWQYTNSATHIYNTSISTSTHIANVVGSPLDDVIVAGNYNCSINGGAGIDTLVYDDSFANCTLTINSNHTSFTITDNSHLLGTDTVANVEQIQFTDQLFSLQMTATIIQNDYLAITRTALSSAQATTIANAINAGTQTETQYVNSLLSQVANTTIPAVAVEASMYNATGTSGEITSLTVNFLPPQIANATHWGLNAQVYACEVLGLAFAFANETGSTAFSNNFGPSNSAMPNTAAGDAAFAFAASSTLFGAASTANLVSVMQNFVSNWEAFYAAHGVPGLSSASAAQIDLAARGAAWGDMVGVALANNLGPVNGQTINFLDDAAQGSAIYGASLVGQPAHHDFFS